MKLKLLTFGYGLSFAEIVFISTVFFWVELKSKRRAEVWIN
jgi:hypothetical protein